MSFSLLIEGHLYGHWLPLQFVLIRTKKLKESFELSICQSCQHYVDWLFPGGGLFILYHFSLTLPWYVLWQMLQWEVLVVVVWSPVSSSLPVMPSLWRQLVTLSSGDLASRVSICPIRGQYSGHVICPDQSQASTQVTWPDPASVQSITINW